MIVQSLYLHHARKTTLLGLREAFSAVPSAPPALSFADYTTLPSEDRAAYDQARFDFLNLTLRVPTPEQEWCSGSVARLIASNPRRKNSRRGLMISAPMVYGKTELALLLARSVERDHALRSPTYVEDGDVPVVWVEVTEHSTGKALLGQIIKFLTPTATPPTRATTEDLRRQAVEMLHAHHTKLLVIDEAHHLGGSEPSSVVKALQNESSATVVLVGISLGSGKAFGTGHGKQVTMRCDMVELRKIDIHTDEGTSLWRRWVATFDRNLPLCDHAPGMLTRNAVILHKAADDGRLAALALIVERLVESILYDPARRDEQITKEKLFSVLDGLRHTTPIRHKIKIEDLDAAA